MFLALLCFSSFATGLAAFCYSSVSVRTAIVGPMTAIVAADGQTSCPACPSNWYICGGGQLYIHIYKLWYTDTCGGARIHAGVHGYILWCTDGYKQWCTNARGESYRDADIGPLVHAQVYKCIL